jgi:hypothetical protein
MIIIPLDDNFEHKTSNEQSAIVDSLQGVLQALV